MIFLSSKILDAVAIVDPGFGRTAPSVLEGIRHQLRIVDQVDHHFLEQESLELLRVVVLLVACHQIVVRLTAVAMVDSIRGLRQLQGSFRFLLTGHLLL